MGISTTCEGCVHIEVPITRDPCRTCWAGGDGGIKTKWEAPMANTPKYPTRMLVDPTGKTPPQTLPTAGRKDDGGKLDVTLFFDDLPHAIEAVTEVLQWAVTKKQPTPYERGSWQGVEDFGRRYRGAQLRHELNRAKSFKADPGHAGSTADGKEPTDAETGLMELAHIATDAMFRLEMAVRKAKGLPVPTGA